MYIIASNYLGAPTYTSTLTSANLALHLQLKKLATQARFTTQSLYEHIKNTEKEEEKQQQARQGTLKTFFKQTPDDSSRNGGTLASINDTIDTVTSPRARLQTTL